LKTERPPGNQAAFLSRENSSNGGSLKPIRTFWQKSYVSLKGSVKEFFQNKRLCFQQLREVINIAQKVAKIGISPDNMPLFNDLSGFSRCPLPWSSAPFNVSGCQACRTTLI